MLGNSSPETWDVTPVEARAIQLRLRDHVVAAGGPSPDDVRLVAGVDISVGGRDAPGLAAVVVLSYPELRPVEQSVVKADVRFPYVPGLLSFREIPVLAPAFEQLKSTPDLVVVDGQGMAHPRRFGLASHLGYLLGVPTIGCAKSRLIGTYAEPRDVVGAFSLLMDRDESIGAAVRTRAGVKPLFISVGHLIGLSEAVAWILRLTRNLRLPEPTRLAHRAAAGELLVQCA
ncbi:MAG: deoxyribonuclease V [Dehalococcoidia bacterium]